MLLIILTLIITILSYRLFDIVVKGSLQHSKFFKIRIKAKEEKTLKIDSQKRISLNLEK